ncbi:uncharacterized protein LOC114868450 isoform X1 [Betta splendens]|uniref:Uncharacterized protein LOC114868450 isoform X1 n=1 Tax=Betta splendens TaxID=158456 RepID=A0A6P7PFA8_BETSP|nr:uncharacterized protein LOC114868450 isoform X1 [Betta splendens]XP_029027894.2 uncharacterized protein LOC114868450 isoform X1 [Betta splendens]
MKASDAGDVKCLMSTVTEENNRMSRSSGRPSCSSSGPASAVASFLVGLLSGAAGGLLLGATAVVVLQALELLDGNQLLVEKLHDFMAVRGANASQSACSERQLNVGVSVLAEALGVLCCVLSLCAGVCAGLWVHAVMTRSCRAAVGGGAVAVAGTVSLLCVAASGSALGRTLETSLAFIFKLDFSMWLSASLYFIGVSYIGLLLSNIIYHCYKLSSSFFFPIIVLILTPGAVYTIVLLALFFKTKLLLLVVLVPVVCACFPLEKTHDFHLITAPVLLMLCVTELFNMADQPIVSFRSVTSADAVGAVHEGVFVGLLASQLFAAAVGMSFVASWPKGGAGRTCAGAAGCGAALLAAVELAAPALGPGPAIGAVLGAAGAAGASLCAAGALAAVERCVWVGRLGVSVGAAAGALVSSCSHSGLSGTFMALCAAAVPAGLYLQLMLSSVHKRCVWPNLRFLYCFLLLAAALLWFNFACTDQPESFGLMPLALIPFLQWVVLLMHTLNMDK